MNDFKTLMILSLVSLSATGCMKKDEAASSISDDDTYAVETGVTSVQGVADDSAGSSYAYSSRATDYKAIVAQLILPKAHAANCSRAIAGACSSGVQVSNYSDCSSGVGVKLTGSVTLTYSNLSCTMSNVNDNVVRTYNQTISGPRSGSLTASSDIHQTYNGVSISGGGKLTKTGASTWQIEVLGKRKTLSYRGRQVFDHSIRTTTPIAVSGSLSRGSRSINSGAYELYHNLAGYTAAFAVTSPLGYSSTCCHPISGSMSVTYSGSRSGSASVTFNGCGSGTFVKDGSTRSLDLSYCE